MRIVAAEKNDLTEEANRIIISIKQMEKSLDDNKSGYESADELKVTYPLSRCLQGLKEKHHQISRIHRERFEQVKSQYRNVDTKSSLLILSQNLSRHSNLIPLTSSRPLSKSHYHQLQARAKSL